MAAILRITDGTTDTAGTVTFSTGSMYVREYTPTTTAELDAPLRERATVGFTTSIATVRANVQAINRFFYQAASYQRNRSGRRIYVEFDPDGSGTPYRSLVYSGVAQPSEDMLGGEWGGVNIEYELEWERDPFWEGPLTQIPLTNGSDTGNTSGIVVNNVNDTGRWNWVSISSSDVSGDLPAPIKLQMQNSTDAATSEREFFVFHNVYSNPSGFRHIIEAETSTDSHVTSTTDATSSSLAYAAIAWDSAATTKIASWPLSSSDMSDAAGGRFALLTRWRGNFPLTDCWIRFKLENPVDASEIWVGNLTLISSTTDGDELTLLDTLRLPPYLEGQSNLGQLDLTMYGKRSSTDNDILLDYIQLSPISGDSGWLRFYSVGQGVYASEYFVHDNTEDLTYRKDTNNKIYAVFSQYGGPVLLVPNAAQKLYFLTSNYSGNVLVAETWKVKLWYRPRRCSI